MSWDTVLEKLVEIVEDGLTGELLKYLIEQFILLVKHLVFTKKRKDCTTDVVCDNDEDRDKDKRVIIVGGSWGEDVALKYNVYACQPYRYFKPARYIAFYHQNRIKHLFEIIGTPKESVDLRIIKDLVKSNYFTVKEPHYAGDQRKYFKLKHVHEFSPEVKNDKTSQNGNPCAFTQKQAYTTYDKIMKATKTSDL